jgi:L-aminopeptidase/D-esterase-like protein
MGLQNKTITAIDGILVGNAEGKRSGSGCTVILFEDGQAVVSHVVGGGSPGSYDTEVFYPTSAREASCNRFRASELLKEVFGVEITCFC